MKNKREKKQKFKVFINGTLNSLYEGLTEKEADGAIKSLKENGQSGYKLPQS